MKQLILLALGAFAFSACGHWRAPRVYEIPEGFTGWAMIEFNVDGAPALQKRDGRLVLSLDLKGRLATSSQEESGFTSDEFYLVGKSKVKLSDRPNSIDRYIWASAMGSIRSPGRKERTYEVFLVGSEADVARFSASPPIPYEK